MNLKVFDVAYYWTPREAAAILDYLDRLRDLVWELYSEDIIELRKDEDVDEGENELDSDDTTDGDSEHQQAFTFEGVKEH